MSRSISIPTLRLLILSAIPLLGTGCFKAPAQTDLMREIQATELTTFQLRVRVRSFLDRYSGVVRDAANQIIDATDDPVIERNALLWKANAIPAGGKAVFQYDPLAALLDVWTLCAQQAEFFDGGAGRDLFGAWQGIAIDASDRLVEHAVAMAQEVKIDDDISHVSGLVDEWVEQEPISSIAFSRSSPRAVLAQLPRRTSRGTGAMIGNLNESVADLSERFAVYASELPYQARWQAELAIDDVMRSDDVQMLLNNTTGLAESLDGTAARLDELPAELTDQVTASLSVLRHEREILTRFVEQQRVATQAFVREERTAVIEAIRREREATLLTVNEERVDTLDRFDLLAAGLLGQASTELRELIDHTLWQATMMLAFLIVVLGVLGIIALRVIGVGR